MQGNPTEHSRSYGKCDSLMQDTISEQLSPLIYYPCTELHMSYDYGYPAPGIQLGRNLVLDVHPYSKS